MQRLQALVIMELLLDICLLYTSDAADERSSVDLGGRRIIKKKTKKNQSGNRSVYKNTKNNKHYNKKSKFKVYRKKNRKRKW